MSDSWSSPRFQADMELKVVAGGPVDYSRQTENPIEYVAVANESSGILGYLWACDEDDAAGWAGRPAVDIDASNSSGYWFMKMREAKARGQLPSQALAELSENPPGGRIGSVVPGSHATASSVAELQEKAREGWQPPARKEAPRRGRG